MKKRLWSLGFLFFAMILAPLWALAGASIGPQKTRNGPDDGAFKVLCQSLPTYRAASGVEYQPGVDVHGRAVAPADLNAPLNSAIDDIVRIPVTVDLVRRFNLYPFFGIELKPDVGTISVHSDGRVEYNGQDLARQAYTLCARDTKIILPPEDGQGLSGGVNSAANTKEKR